MSACVVPLCLAIFLSSRAPCYFTVNNNALRVYLNGDEERGFEGVDFKVRDYFRVGHSRPQGTVDYTEDSRQEGDESRQGQRGPFCTR